MTKSSEEQDSTMLDDSSPSQSLPPTTTKGNSSARLAPAPDHTQKGLNANGKRTLAAVTAEMAAANNNLPPVVDLTGPHVAETVPGAAWKSQKAQLEISKALDMIVDKDLMIGGTYIPLYICA